MKRKIYNLLSDAKLLLALVLVVSMSTAYSQTTYTFNYTGSQQTINLQAGTYTIEAWGGDGGNNLGNGSSTFLQNGGKGGYSMGVFTLSSPATVYVNVGGKGGNSTSSLSVTVNGGYNGGGYGSQNTTSGKSSGAGGGGASHVATASGTLGALASNTAAVYIVAGGGGGAGESNYASNNTQYNSNGGFGGGLSGLQNISTGYQGRHGKGGTQTVGGTGGDNATANAGPPLQGTFGVGGFNPVLGANSSAGGSGIGGGGAGWYGGGAGWGGAATSFCAGSGGGGSGYIGGVNNGTTIVSGQSGFITNPDVSGNGMILIKELCNITLVPSTSNTVNPVICAGQSLTLTTNAISNYSWNTGATSSSLVVAPTTNTVYSLTATSPSNCTTTRSISVTVSSGQPTLSVLSSTSQACLGSTVTLTASGAVTYTWSNNVTNGVAFTPTATSTYTVSGQNGCGTATAVTTVSIGPLPVTASSNPTIICAGSSSTLSVVAAANSYTWAGPTLTLTSSTPSQIVSPAATSIYTVTVSDGTCSGITNLTLTANPVPTVTSASSTSLICPGESVTLTASGANSYSWSWTGGGSATGSMIVASPTAPTLYNVLGDNSFNCLGNSSQVVIVGQQPTLVVSSNSNEICAGGSATLSATGANTYAWQGGPSTSNYVVSPGQTTIFSVTGTLSSSGCADTKTISIDVFAPVMTISGNTVICSGSSTSFTASAPGALPNSFTWNPGSVPLPVISNLSPPVNTIYTVSATSNSNTLLCPVSGTVELKVNPNPTVTAASNRTAMCKGEVATLSASGAGTYLWSSFSTTLSTSPSFTISSSTVGILVYTVTGTDAMGCSDSKVVSLVVNGCVGLNEVKGTEWKLLIYPNPNNGEFVIESPAEKNLILLNGLGQVVKRLELNAENGYRIELKDLSAGVYFVSDIDGGVKEKIIVTKN